MSDLTSPPSDDRPSETVRASSHVRRVAARGQWLVDTPRPRDGHSLRWHAEALYVGDITALVAAALRERRQR
ncbi:MAG TPA: hypothetical protein VIY10_19715 [Solirubrobacteraceae bacterium]|jgi:hypothetical protein